jgi:murein DD-endopeptidase MepM/ murein hydrolase activator NlpD
MVAAPPVTPVSQQIHVVQPGDTLSMLAARYNTTVFALMNANAITNPNLIYVGQRLVIPGLPTVPLAAPVAPSLLSPLDTVWLEGEPVQGEAALLWVRAANGATVTGTYGTQTFYFHEHCGLQWGLVAFDAMLDEPGTHEVQLTATGADGARVIAKLAIPILDGDYWEGPPVRFPADKQPLLQREVINGENEMLARLFAATTDPTSPPRWSGLFWRPIDSVVTGWFGATAIVNGEPTGYHEGIDFRGRVGTPFYAPAAGTVVLAEPLRVRGGTVFLDHGAGVISGFFHMSGFNVAPGDQVQAGDLLGWIGDSGLTTGPHLHWEMRVNNQWVSPWPWMRRTFP